MASSRGADASKTALEARYHHAMPVVGFRSHRADVIDTLDQLKGMDIWARTNVVLVPFRGVDGIDMERVAEEALSAGKRVGVCVVVDASDASTTAFTEAPDDSTVVPDDAAVASDVPATASFVDCVEVYSPTEIHEPCVEQLKTALLGNSEGDTTGFSCLELLDALCIVPGLVFDGEGYRVDRDEDAYNRFLTFFPGNKVALVTPLQISSNPLPRSEHSIPVDYLVSEKAIWRCR